LKQKREGRRKRERKNAIGNNAKTFVMGSGDSEENECGFGDKRATGQGSK
jgi:hypothetical protein